MRNPYFKKIKVIVDFESKTPHFICIQTANNKLIASGEWWIEKKDMYLSDVTVQERYRGKGFGSLLARIMISIGKYYQVETISLINGSTLKRFWERLGFKSRKGMERSVLKLKQVK